MNERTKNVVTNPQNQQIQITDEDVYKADQIYKKLKKKLRDSRLFENE